MIDNFIPKHFKTAEGTLLSAIRKAIAQESDRLNKMIEAGIDQQFVSTATGKYLLFLGEQEGFAMPPNSGLDIRALRALIPAMVASPKQVVSTLNKLIEIFYTTEKVKPSVTATVAEPYSLANGDNLLIETESGKVEISFLADQVSDISNISAAELAGVINNSQSIFSASVYLNRINNKKFLRLTSKTYGIGAYVKVVGGTSQNVLKFDKLRDTSISSGTTFSLSKPATYSDKITLTWNGVGTNPKLYNASPGDIVSIRGLVDGIDPLSFLNGSFTLLDVGYDYIVFANDHFPATAASVVSASDTFAITSSDKNTLYDLSEYAILSETENASTVITVPAIPPLARRFLQGSAHLHGNETEVLDFTRGTLTVDTSFSETPPEGMNLLTLFGDGLRYNFRKDNLIKSEGSNDLPFRTYTLDYTDPSYAVLPFTVAEPLATDSLYAEPGSDEIVVTFPFKHGLYRPWGFTLSASSGAGNFTALSLSQEHEVAEVLSGNSVKFRLYSAGLPVKFSGVSFTNFDVIRWATPQSDESDFYLQFPTSGDVTASGLYVGAVFRLDGSLGTTLDPFWGERVRRGRMVVKSINGSIVTFFSGFGTGVGGTVLQSGTGYRSANFGGNVSYFFDKTSTYNQEILLSLKAHWLGSVKSSNSAYVGSYLYDTTGEKTSVTVSDVVVNLTQPVLKGSNQVSLFVDSVDRLPSTGYIVIDYGSSSQEGPIHYISTIKNNAGDSQILIDPSYRFKHSRPVGGNVQYIHKLATYVPDTLGTDYPVYLTGTAQARNTMLSLLRMLIATGVFLDFQVLYPELRFSDPSIQPFE